MASHAQTPTGKVHSDSDSADADRGVVSQAQDTLADVKANVGDTAGKAMNAAQDRVQDTKAALTDAASNSVNAAQDRFQDAKTSVTDMASKTADAAQDRLQDAKAAAMNAANNSVSATQDRFQDAKTAVSGAASNSVTAAQDRLQDVKTAVGSLGDTAGQQLGQAKQAADQGATQAGTQLTDLASSLREKARTIDDGSPLNTAAARAADALEGAGGYLQSTGPDDWMTDLKQQIERRPLAAVVVAMVIGFLLARTLGGPRTVVINRDYSQTPTVVPPEA